MLFLDPRRGLYRWPRSRLQHELRAPRVLDEHLLCETVRVVNVLVVVSFGDFADPRELVDPERTAGLAEGLEGVFRLTSGHDVADEAEEIALAHRIGEIACNTEGLAEHLLTDASFGADSRLEIFQHPLMLAHARDVTGAQVAKALILRLTLVILEVLQEGSVLHHRVVDLALQKVDAALHTACLQ